MMRQARSYRWPLIMALLLCGVSSSCALAVDTTQDATELEATAGWLFIDGTYIAAPYQIVAQGDTVSVNGIAIPALAEETERSDAPALRSQNRGTWHPNEFRSRRSGRPGMGRGQGRFPPPPDFNGSAAALQPQQRLLRELAINLDDNGVVVLFTGQPIRALHGTAEKYQFFKALSAPQKTAQLTAGFLQLAPLAIHQDTWRQFLVDFAPDDGLRSQMLAFISESDHIDAINQQAVKAGETLQSLAYPLTVIAMILGVLAFGHMLQWVAKGLMDGQNDSDDASRFAAKAILLMIGMSVIDVVWTILAVRAGVMSEVNPLANQFAASPMQLVAFKVVATGSALAILFMWRRVHQIQKATWWACLICVLLTFRWVVFDSIVV